MDKDRIWHLLYYIRWQLIVNNLYPEDWDELKLKAYLLVFYYDKEMYLRTAKPATGLTYIRGWVPYPREWFFEWALRKIFGPDYYIPRESRHQWHHRVARRFEDAH